MNINQLRETKLFKSTRAKFNDVEYYYTEVEPALMREAQNGANLAQALVASFIWDNSEKGYNFWCSTSRGEVI